MMQDASCKKHVLLAGHPTNAQSKLHLYHNCIVLFIPVPRFYCTPVILKGLPGRF